MAEMLAGSTQGVVAAEDVDRDGLLEDRRIPADERELGGDPGIGHDDVKAAEGPGGSVDLGTVTHVARPPRGVHPRCGRREELLFEPRKRKPRPAGVKSFGEGRPDATGGARDEDAATGEGR